LPHYTRILDLGDVAAGKVAGRQSDSQRIIAMKLGLVLDDLATAPPRSSGGGREGPWHVARFLTRRDNGRATICLLWSGDPVKKIPLILSTILGRR